MKLIIGLGNPGIRYRNTRHNIGFLAVKQIAKGFRITVKKRNYRGILGFGKIRSEEILLFMPQTYMNLSGEAVFEIARANNIRCEDLLVICDDADLKLGVIRLRNKGSSGGHKGLDSIIYYLGTNAFPRLRVGIGKPQEQKNLSGYVLSRFSAEEKRHLNKVMQRTKDCAVMWIEEGVERAMAIFNRRTADYADE